MARPAASDQAVLDGARRALDRFGWEQLTIARIGEEAGLSRATLHRRGVTKEAILERLAAQAVERYREAMWPVLTGGGSGVERLERALVVLCQLAEENLSLLQALDAQANAAVFHDPGHGETLTRAVFTEPLDRLLRDGVGDGTVRKTDFVETATVLFNLVGWTYIHLRTGHGWRPERAQTATVEIALHGVL